MNKIKHLKKNVENYSSNYDKSPFIKVDEKTDAAVSGWLEITKSLKTQIENLKKPDAVIVIDEYQKILEWNPKAEAIFGFTADEVIGSPLSETIIPHKYREAHKKGMAHFLQSGEGPVLNKTIDITALHKKGHEFYINLSISNVKMDGQWLFIAFLSDITERKKTEETLIYQEAELLQAKLLDQN